LCGIGIKKPYYYTGLGYKGEIYAIKKIFELDYRPLLDSEGNDGIIRISFDVNCKGVAGNFKMEQYTLDYKAAIIDEKISSQILMIVKSLNNWLPGKNDEGQYVNSFMFLSFRIVNGEIQEILPK
jgi:hypothetical protein